MTIAIALAVIAVVAVAGVWLLRRQAAEQRDGEPAPRIEDGPPARAEEGAEARPAADFPWRERPGDRPGDDGLPPDHDLPPSASPDAVPAGRLPDPRGDGLRPGR
ncbi:hypothetical protein [Actinacidiphila reveromycinica]|uniref:hypothetical protein n=1 Tax=Actinacidiphila reveromycinica TaxID=659352 RepID=UPI0019225EA8|nr:hypothetical protein [Streptomyces sp. SN-593]